MINHPIIEATANGQSSRARLNQGLIYRTRISLIIDDVDPQAITGITSNTTLKNVYYGTNTATRVLRSPIAMHTAAHQFIEDMHQVLGDRNKNWATKNYVIGDAVIYLYTRDMEWMLLAKLHGYGVIVDQITRIEKLIG